MTPEQYTHAIERILERGGLDCVRFGQEVGWHLSERELWTKLMRDESLVTYGMDHFTRGWSPYANPISLSHECWYVVQTDTPYVVYTQSGIEEQPQRVITRVNAEREGVPIAFINFHNYSEAGKDQAHVKAWWDYWTAVRRISHDAYHEGYNVIVGGDSNSYGLNFTKGKPPALFPNIGVEAVWNAPDGIWLAPQPGMHVRVIRSWKIPETETGLDHMSIGAFVEWTEK